MNIVGYCRSNDDNLAGERWPRVFAVVPLKGQRVRSMGGRIAYVANIEHFSRDKTGVETPHIEVELATLSSMLG